MQTNSLQLLRRAGVLTATLLALPSVRVTAADKTDAFPTFDSYIKISGQSASISGDRAAFQARTGEPKDVSGGLEELHYIYDLSKETTLKVDARALADAEDYLLRFNLAKSEVGSIDAGYKRFRTFYDGVGGFFPGSNSFSRLNPDDLFVDRGEFWTEIKIARPDQPEFTVRYTNGTRNGRKDSTIWGESDDTGIPYGTNGATPTRKFAASYLDLDERHQTLEGTGKITKGNTTAQLTLLGDWANKDNSRYVDRFPGETRAPNAAGTGVTPTTGSTLWQSFNNEIVTTSYDQQDTTTKGANLKTVTELNSRVTLRFAGGYDDVSSSFGGDRILVTDQPITGNPSRTITTYNVKDLDGASNADVYTGSVGVDIKVLDDLTASFGVRGENKNADSDAQYDVVTSTTGAVPVASTTRRLESSSIDEKSVTPVVDLRYTGIKTVALYAIVSRKFGDGSEFQTPAYNPATLAAGATPRTLYRDVDEDAIDYTLGANWRATSALTLRGETFYKDHSYQGHGYDASAAVTPVRTPINYELDSQFWGVKLTAVVRPLATLTTTTRYIWQQGQRQVTGSPGSVASNEYDSMDSTTHTIGETIDWTPIAQFYMQANADVVFNVISTAYPQSGTPANNVLQNSDNNYYTASLLVGFVLTKRDDLQVQGTYYRAANGNAYLDANTQPYGVNESEFTVSVGLIHKVSDRFIASAKVGYFEHKNDTTGGNTDFRGPLAYVSVTYGL